MKKCLTIAGSDCSGGAGIQADLKAFSANGVYAMSVITSVVAENTSRVISVYNVKTQEIEKQIDAVFEDIEVDSVKLGMLPEVEIIKAVSAKLKQYSPKFIVCDPVMTATSGDTLSGVGTVDALIKYIFPIADIITPNIPEAEKIAKVKINNLEDFDKAAKIIMQMDVKNLLIKGGHFQEDCVDILYKTNSQGGYDKFCFCQKRIDSPNTHGTGCTLSSSIAANLAKEMPIEKAVEEAKKYVTQAIEKSFNVGKGHSPVNHFYEYYTMKGIN